MRRIGLVSIVAATAFAGAIGWFVGVCSESKVSEQALQTLEGGEQAYLRERFQTAYERMEPMIAIWEGTNLILYLKANQTKGPASQQELASEILLNSRLSALFRETARNDQAHYFAQCAFSLLHEFDSNAVYTPDQVVERTLAVESVKRRYVKGLPQ